MLHRPADDDDGLQRWLAGRPGWPLVAAPDGDPEPTLDVRVVGGGTLLHAAAERYADRAAAGLIGGDVVAARRARELLAAIAQELRA